MVTVNEAFPKGRKFNQDYFISSIPPWLMKEKRRFTGKNPGAAFLLRRTIPHATVASIILHSSFSTEQQVQHISLEQPNDI
jgi:hypothetical protein